MPSPFLKLFNYLIERDPKSSSYKFALLKGITEIVLENSPYLVKRNGFYEIPFTLLIEKWIVYYYTIFNEEDLMPQIGAGVKLAIENELREAVKEYRNKGGLEMVLKDFRKAKAEQTPLIRSLSKKIKDTILKQPMKFLGTSYYGQHYSIFQKAEESKSKINNRIYDYGLFTCREDFIEGIGTYGDFLIGQNSLIMQWAKYTHNLNKRVPITKVLDVVNKQPITEREVSDAKRFYTSKLRSGNLNCVWSGVAINNSNLNIDHLIPFSLWHNNNIWNLLPAHEKINSKKSDKIPSLVQLEKSKDRIISNWQMAHESFGDYFLNEVKDALIGNNSNGNWELLAFERIKLNCHHLIENKGYSPFEL